jgi:hypothetical protein
MGLSPSWEAASRSATQELPSILWNPKIDHRVHKSSPLVPKLNHSDTVQTIPSHLSKIYFNIVRPSVLGLPSGLFPSDFPTNMTTWNTNIYYLSWKKVSD